MVLQKIKQLLGMGSQTNDTGRTERDVVVQEETTTADTETESAVKGVEDDGFEADDADEPVAAGTDADASTESLVDEAETQEHSESRAEPAEAADPASEDESPDVEAADDATEDGVNVDQIKGIGPAYSERLGEVGIHNVADLADADPEELAERVTVSEKTVRKWIDRAQSDDA